MNYELILKNLKPNKKEKETVKKTSVKVINLINNICHEEGINAKPYAVGSVAKNTWLSGKSDIDIFISFPYDCGIDYLKEKGLYLAYKINNALKGSASEHYASHPYLTCFIDGFEVDIVPCYDLSGCKPVRSAVDRTILHTNYIKSHLTEEQEDEVLLLKRFMDVIGTYGSEFKTGGFAGYLCELLILNYGTFENTLRNAQNWKFNIGFDLENYGTLKYFKNNPLTCIDPTDKNRNVGAALRIEKFVDFILASRNFIKIVDDDGLNEAEKEKKIAEFFNPLVKKHLNKSNKEIVQDILNSFKDRETQVLIIKFNIPKIPSDTIHPQLLKTIKSINEKVNAEEFNVFKYDYWIVEDKFVIFIIELNVFKQSKYYIHKGPKVWSKKSCDNFKKKWEDALLYPLNDFMTLTRERKFKTAKEFINYTLKENTQIIKVGKNIKKVIVNSEILEIDEFLNDLDNQFNEFTKKTSDDLIFDYLNSLDDFLNPGQYIKR